MTGHRRILNLALIGFMGTGKTTVGKQAAELLGFEFLDTDHEIESRSGKTITEIFADHGEPVFRQLESSLVQELTNRAQTVIATGGGLPVNPQNMESLKEHALVVCLWAAPERIYERVKDHSHRPLLHNPDPLAKIRDLLAQREPFYRQADVLINTEGRPLREVAAQVVHQFQAAQQQTNEGGH